MVSPFQPSFKYPSSSVSNKYPQPSAPSSSGLLTRTIKCKQTLLGLEIMGPAYRTFAGMMLSLFFAVALMILAGLAYIFNSWQQLALVTSVPFVALFSYWFFVPESPRWLLSYARISEAEVIVQQIARWNKREIHPTFVHDFVEQEKVKQARKKSIANGKKKSVNRKPSMWVLLWYYPVARRNFFLITFNWLANALVYNGLSFYSADLRVSSHLGFFISSAVEIPSYFVGWYVMDKWGRRWILFATMMTGGISCICCMFVPLSKSLLTQTPKVQVKSMVPDLFFRCFAVDHGDSGHDWKVFHRCIVCRDLCLRWRANAYRGTQ